MLEKPDEVRNLVVISFQFHSANFDFHIEKFIDSFGIELNRLYFACYHVTNMSIPKNIHRNSKNGSASYFWDLAALALAALLR